MTKSYAFNASKDSLDLQSVESQESVKRLCLKTKVFYSFGHIYNDLCATVWFSYTLIYFDLQFEGTVAGFLILLGQLADAIATPFIGFQSDRTNWLCRYGKRKTWHLVGTILVTTSFPFIFNECIQCENASQNAKIFYYSAFIVIFQFGWAAVQVGHVSLITDLTDCCNERVELNAYRQAATVASSICVYTIAWFLLSKEGDQTIHKSDSSIFTLVVYIICVIGLGFSILFHIFVSEPSKSRKSLTDSFDSSRDLIVHQIYRKRLSSFSSQVCVEKSYPTDDSVDSNLTSDTPEVHKWSDWFRNIDFYRVGFVYMVSRLFVNVTQTYTPLFLQKTLQLPQKSIAIIPFVTYISGFVWSLLTRFLFLKSGPKIVLLVGCVFGIGSCVWNQFGSHDNEDFKNWQIYGSSLLFGVGGTTMLIASLALTTDLIGNNSGSAGFVFGTMSFFDKILNGAVVVVLEEFNPNRRQDKSSTVSVVYYKQIIVFVSGSAIILAILGLLSLIRSKLGDVADSGDVKTKVERF